MTSGKFLMALAAIATVAMSSCTQEDEVITPDNQISNNAVKFSTYIGKTPTSRGTIIDTQEFKKSSTGFGVIAYYTGQSDFSTSSTPNFMYNQQVKWTGSQASGTGTEGEGTEGEDTNGEWTYTPLKYWPNNNNDKISFFAYAPYSDIPDGTTEGITALSANNIAGDPTLTFTVPSTVTSQIDLLYADATEPENESETTSTTYKIVDLTKPSVTDKVTFKFKHALARVSFQCQLLIDGSSNKPLDTETTLTIEEVTFSPTNFGTTGTLNLHTGVWNVTASTNPTYTLNSSNFINNSNVLSSSSGNSPVDLTSTDGNIMFIPAQQTAAEGAEGNTNNNSTITVKYKVKTIDTKLSLGYSEITNEKTVTVPNNIKFEQGKNYKFILKIGLTTVRLDADVSDWDTVSNTEWSTTF